MKTHLFFIMVIVALFAGACSSTFLLAKHEKHAFLNSDIREKYTLLCTSGDLEKVLAATQLSKELKESLYKYNCSEERSGAKVGQLYASMTSVQRKDIKNAFRRNGFMINIHSC